MRILGNFLWKFLKLQWESPLKGTVHPKNEQISKNCFLFLMKCQYVADVVVEFHSCETYVKGGLGGLKGTTIHQYLRNVCRKIDLLKSFRFATSKEPNSDSFWATGLILVSTEAEFCIYKVTESFFLIFEVWKILHRLKFQFFRQKIIFLKKKCITRKLKWNSKKKLRVVL